MLEGGGWGAAVFRRLRLNAQRVTRNAQRAEGAELGTRNPERSSEARASRMRGDRLPDELA